MLQPSYQTPGNKDEGESCKIRWLKAKAEGGWLLQGTWSLSLGPGPPSSRRLAKWREQTSHLIQATTSSSFLLLMFEWNPRLIYFAYGILDFCNKQPCYPTVGRSGPAQWACSMHITFWELTAFCPTAKEF